MTKEERRTKLDEIQDSLDEINSWLRYRSFFELSDSEHAKQLAQKYSTDISFLLDELARLEELYDSVCDELCFDYN